MARACVSVSIRRHLQCSYREHSQLCARTVRRAERQAQHGIGGAVMVPMSYAIITRCKHENVATVVRTTLQVVWGLKTYVSDQLRYILKALHAVLCNPDLHKIYVLVRAPTHTVSMGGIDVVG